MWPWGMWKTLHYCSPSEGEFMQDRRDTVHVCVCIVSIVIYPLLNSCGFQKMFRYTKDRILGISHTFVNMWVVAKSLQQVRVFFMLPTFFGTCIIFLSAVFKGMVSRVTSEHTPERNRIAVRSSTASSLSKPLETYKNTQEHIQVFVWPVIMVSSCL